MHKTKLHSSQAFTLVELIVVMVTLAILGTIGFISFQGYSVSARDSVRIGDINNIVKSLELFALEHNLYPNPSEGIQVTYSGSEVWTQGTIGESVITKLRRLSDKPIDPSTGLEYTYSLTRNNKEYQVGAAVEKQIAYENNMLTNFVSSSTANVLQAYAYIKGNYNGKIVTTQTGGILYIFAAPSIISTQLSNPSIEYIADNSQFVYQGFSNIPSSYSGSNFQTEGGFTFRSSPLIVYSGGIDNLTQESIQRDLVSNIKDNYEDSILQDLPKYENIVNINTTKQKYVNNYVYNLTKNFVGGFPNIDIKYNNTKNIPPIIDLDSSISGYTGKAITFAAHASDPDGAIVQYEWFDTSGVSIEGENSDSYTTTFHSEGNYTIGLEVTDDEGLTSRKDVSVEIIDLIYQLTVNDTYFRTSPRDFEVRDSQGNIISHQVISGAFNGAPPKTIIFKTSEKISSIGYPNMRHSRRDSTWSDFDVYFDPNGFNQLLIDGGGWPRSGAGRQESVPNHPQNYPPTVNLGNDILLGINRGFTIHAQASDSDGTIVSYQWFDHNGDAIPGVIGDTYTPQFNTSGSYNISVMVTDNTGNTASDSVTIQVSEHTYRIQVNSTYYNTRPRAFYVSDSSNNRLLIADISGGEGNLVKSFDVQPSAFVDFVTTTPVATIGYDYLWQRDSTWSSFEFYFDPDNTNQNLVNGGWPKSRSGKSVSVPTH